MKVIYVVEVTYIDKRGNEWKEIDGIAYQTEAKAKEYQKFLSNEERNQKDLETYGMRALKSEIKELILD